MENIKKVEYEIYNNGFVKIIGVKEVKYTDDKTYIEYDNSNVREIDDYTIARRKNYEKMPVNEYEELGLYLNKSYYIIDRKYYLLFKTNSSKYNPTDYGTVKIDHVKDYEIKKTGLYACEIIVNSGVYSYNKTFNIDRCEVSSGDSKIYYAYGMNNQELERIENEASLMAASYSGIMATNYVIDDALSKAEYLRNYN